MEVVGRVGLVGRVVWVGVGGCGVVARGRGLRWSGGEGVCVVRRGCKPCIEKPRVRFRHFSRHE